MQLTSPDFGGGVTFSLEWKRSQVVTVGIVFLAYNMTSGHTWKESGSPSLIGLLSGPQWKSLPLGPGKLHIPGVKCGDFVEIISVSLRSLFEVFLSLLILNETKESGKMEVLGFGNRCSSSKKEFCFKNILLLCFEEIRILRTFEVKLTNT